MRLRLAAAVVGAAALAATAAAAPQRELQIRPGTGIGDVRIGMTLAQVERARGRPPDQRRVEPRSFRVRSVVLTWWSGLADHFVVGLLGRRGAERVVTISTSRSDARTREGVGPGAHVSRLTAAFPRAVCRQRARPEGGVRTEYVLDPRARNQTIFVTGSGNSGHGKFSRDVLAFVVVRAPSARRPGAVQPCR